MPRPITENAAARLRSYFEEAGYTEAGLASRVSLTEFATADTRTLPRMLARTSEPSPVNALTRLFWLGLEQSRDAITKVLPEDVLTILLESGVAEAIGPAIVPQVAFWPVAKFLIASDHYSALRRAGATWFCGPTPLPTHCGVMPFATASGRCSIWARATGSLVCWLP